MKRTSPKNKPELVLKRKLQLVRTIIRELTPGQLEQVNGGDTEYYPSACSITRMSQEQNDAND